MTDHQGPPTLSLALHSVLSAAVEADERGTLLSILRRADADAGDEPGDEPAARPGDERPDGAVPRSRDGLLAFPSPRRPSDDWCAELAGTDAGAARVVGILSVAVPATGPGRPAGPDDEGPDAA